MIYLFDFLLFVTFTYILLNHPFDMFMIIYIFLILKMLLHYIIGFIMILGISDVHKSPFALIKLIKIFDNSFSILFEFMIKMYIIFIVI